MLHLIAAALIALFVTIALSASLRKSPAYDEPGHVGAALSYVATGDIKINLVHPPLLRELSGLSLLAGGVRWPISRPVWDALGPRPAMGIMWQVGDMVLFSDGDPARVLFWARLPLILLAALLGLVIYLWGRRMLGGTAGIAALALFAADPNIVAHSAMVTTDVGCAAFATLFVFTLWRYVTHPTLGRAAVAGMALGGALGAKYSSIFLIPIGIVLLVVAAWHVRDGRSPSSGPAWVNPFVATGRWRRIARAAAVFALMGAIAFVVIDALYFFPPFPFTYLEGLALVNADHRSEYQAYLAGRFAPHFPSYFLVAYLLKEPLPSILLAGVGIWAIFRRGGQAPLSGTGDGGQPTALAAGSRGLRPLDRAFLLVPAVVLFGAYTIYAANMGIRYVIPVLPFIHLIGGAGAAYLIRVGKAGRWLVGALGLWLTAGAAGIYPDHLSYFNEAACLRRNPERIGAAGGTRCGPDWLDDSNVDWGQGLIQLSAWIRSNPSSAPLRFAYHGSTDPIRYGIDSERIDVVDLYDQPLPGRWVVSAHFKARAEGALAGVFGDGPENWLRHMKPTAIVGNAYYVYDVPMPGRP